MTDPLLLPQTLILPPALSFAAVSAVLAEAGFTQDEGGTVTRPVLPGEPEAAFWRHPSGLPVVAYAFNPVVRLRLLEVATVPPALRGWLAARLSALPRGAVRAALEDDDDRQRLFGVWAAVETERTDLAHEVALVRDTARGALREEAEAAVARLADLADDRLKVLAAARLLREVACEAILAADTADAVERMAPTPAECAALFDAAIAERLAGPLAARGRPPDRGLPPPGGADSVAVAPAGAFRSTNELSAPFPGGYRRIAGWMRPACLWVAWKSGPTRFDGLAFVQGRWVFLPKPWRLVDPLLPALPGDSFAGAP